MTHEAPFKCPHCSADQPRISAIPTQFSEQNFHVMYVCLECNKILNMAPWPLDQPHPFRPESAVVKQ